MVCLKKFLKQPLCLRDCVAMLLPILVLGCIPLMFMTELKVLPGGQFDIQHYTGLVLPALKKYGLLFGVALLLTGISLLLLGQEDTVVTKTETK